MIAVMWKPAAAVTILNMAGATAHAQQQRSPIDNLDKRYRSLLRTAEDLSEDMPKFVLQKEESIVICQINSQMEKKTVSSLGRGGDDGLEIKP